MPNPVAGFFGKLPSAGDFVQRRLPAGFVDVWDQHFENAVAASRGALGGDWHEAYHASPVWRFLLAPGVCGDSAWLGVMGPGTDRVGRCFPMVIAIPLAADPESCRQTLLDDGGWCDAAERLHNMAQNDAALGVDAFDEQVAALAGSLDAMLPSRGLGFLRGVDWNAAAHWRLPLPTEPAMGAFLSELWARLGAAPGHWCLWWTTGAGRVPASVLVTNGLPQPAAYAGLLDAGHSAAAWQSLGVFEQSPASHRMAPEPMVAVAAANPEPAPPTAWLPDDLELLADLDVTAVPLAAAASPAAAAAGAVAEVSEQDSYQAVVVLHRQDFALTLVAAQVGHRDPRQQAVATVGTIGRELVEADLAAGMQTLRTRIMALNPRLRQAGEDLIDPVTEDCAVIAAHVAAGQVGLLRIGTAAAWHWRHGRLQPIFAEGEASSMAADAGAADDFDDLLFNRASLTAPGLGAIEQPACSEISCATAAGDRLLLAAAPALVQLPPEVLVHSLAMPSCDDARLHLATAAGLGADPAQWPLAIIEIDA